MKQCLILVLLVFVLPTLASADGRSYVWTYVARFLALSPGTIHPL